MFMILSGSIWDMMESTNPLDFDFGYANGEYCPQICDVLFSNYANYGCSWEDYWIFSLATSNIENDRQWGEGRGRDML